MDTTHLAPGSIVVGIDGSAGSDDALAWGIEQAKLEQRPLTLVHAVTPLSTAWTGQAGLDYEYLVGVGRSGGLSLLEKARDKVHHAAPGVDVHELIRLHDPRQVLLELSEHAAMIVLGSRGLGPVRSLMLGSVSVAVSEHASCPVVVIRPHNPGRVRRGVLVGTDGTERSLPVVEFAYRQASLRSLPLTVMHCSWATDDLRRTGDLPEEQKPRLALAESVAGFGEKFPDVHVTLKIERGLAEECLVSRSDTMDLVVVGSHPRSRVSSLLLADVGRSVVEHASCVVALVPTLPTSE